MENFPATQQSLIARANTGDIDARRKALGELFEPSPPYPVNNIGEDLFSYAYYVILPAIFRQLFNFLTH